MARRSARHAGGLFEMRVAAFVAAARRSARHAGCLFEIRMRVIVATARRSARHAGGLFEMRVAALGHGTEAVALQSSPHMMPPARRRLSEQERFMLLLIAPAAAILLLFQVVPILIGANASFRDWTLYDPKKTWVGLAHYRAVVTDPAFLTIVLPNTFLFMTVSVGASLLLGLALALLLNRPFRGQKLVQTVLLMPLMVAPVIAAIMLRWMFNDQFGIVNVVLEALGFVWTLSGGGPGRSTELFSLYAYVYAFLNLDFGKGSAAAMIGGAIILVVGLGLFRVLDRLVQVSR